jgi:hypothetical protein
MVWTITLIVNDCNTNDPIEGVRVFPLVDLDTGFPTFTDANGQVIAAFEDSLPAQIVQLQKTSSSTTAAHGYIERSHTFNRVNNGDIETVCLNPAPPPDPTGEGEPVSCFLVTAATGSPVSAEVTALRAARERVARRSAIAARLIERFYAEYASFSPPLAERLRHDAAAREKVRRLVVSPLFSWYQLALALAFDHRDRAAVAAATRTHLDARQAANATGALASELATLGIARTGGAGDPAYAPLALAAARLDVARWAVVDPLVAIAAGSADLEAAVAAWLSNAPLERLDPPDDPAELVALAAFLEFAPHARRRLGARLAAAWPQLSFELEAVGFARNVEIISE